MSLRAWTHNAHKTQNASNPVAKVYKNYRCNHRLYGRTLSTVQLRAANNADAEGANPDPWLTPVQSMQTQTNTPDEVVKFDASAVASAAAAGAPLPPSPWDTSPSDAQVSVVPSASTGAQASSSGRSPPAAAASPTNINSSASAPSETPAAAARADPPGAAPAPEAAADAPAASGRSGDGASATSVDGSTGAASGSSASGGNGGGRFNVREASAALSEDTAALLARLRAELARTSNIKMPPRWTSSSTRAQQAATASGTTPTESSGTTPTESSGVPQGSGAAPAGSSSAVAGAREGSITAPAGSAGVGAGAGEPRVVAAASSSSGTIPTDSVRNGSTAAAAAAPARTDAPTPTGDVVPTSEAAAEPAAKQPGFGDGFLSFLRRPAASSTTADVTEGAASASAAASAAAAAAAAAAAGASPASKAVGPASSGSPSGSAPTSTATSTSTSTSTPASTSTAAPTAPRAADASSAAPPSTAGAPAGNATAREEAAATAAGASSTSTPPASWARPSSGGSTSTTTNNNTSTSSGATSAPSRGGTASTSNGIRSSSGVGGSGRRRRAVVVGGGIGGLVSAARLAKEGLSVTLLEANSQVGGRCQSVQRGRFRFDTGPSLLLFIETYRKTFAALGTSLPQQVPVVRVTPAAYRVFFQGAGSLDMLFDVQRMVEQLEAVEKGAGGKYLDWLATSRAALQLGVEGFIERDADNLADLVGRALQDGELRSLLTTVGPVELLGTHYARMSRRFRDPRLRAMFTFQDLYVGLSPYTAPGVYSLLAATEITDGVWYPLGGFGQIRDALVRVGQSLGVRVRCGARVAGIRTATGEAGGQRVAGVTLASGEELDADVVVSNRDVPLTYDLLRGPAESHGSIQARRVLSQDYSAGVIAFNWSLNKKLDALLHHNVFLSGDFAGSWERATSPETLARSPNFYVHCPSRTDPTAAPSGSDSVMVLLPVANIQEIVKAQEAERHRDGPLAALPGPLAAAAAAVTAGGAAPDAAAAAARVSYSALVAAGREAILRTMAEAGIANVRQHIVDEMVIDPVEWRDRYSLAHGAAFGLSHGLNQLSVFRPGVADKQVRGLYLVGASTRPGNGVPLTMISADLVTQRVMQDVAAGVL